MSTQTQRFTYATATNAPYIEDQYARFKADPTTVEESWRKFFEGYEFALSSGGAAQASGNDGQVGHDNAKVEAFINAYRTLGHFSAHLDPLSPKPSIKADMLPEAHGLGGIDAEQTFHPANLPELGAISFKNIYNLLLDTYCGRIGAEFRELEDIEMVKWIQGKMESCRNRPELPADVKKRILKKLAESEGFERFLQARYLGQKRFSLEGAESFVALMDTVINEGANSNVEEICIGMAHRGRLNTLCNTLNKAPELTLKEFEGSEFNPFDIDGDVKYHMGFASEVDSFSGKKVRLYLSPNPSHLEAVNPVVEGFVRARQRLLDDNDATRVMPVLVHGDASFMGQGLVAETLNLSELEMYRTGGTIHVIINNQVGFTTSPSDSRSCTYSSGMAKILRAPVLHVNADDPEAVVWCAMLAVSFRQKFHRDIVIDLIGYRRHGHNETDEPSFTQPLMYKTIAAQPTVLSQYGKALVSAGIVSQAEADRENEIVKNRLQSAYEAVHDKKDAPKPLVVVPALLQRAMAYKKATEAEIETAVETGFPSKKLKNIGTRICTVPKGFTPHSKVVRLLENRLKMLEGKGAVDWALGELLAFATLAAEGQHVRLSGQDCQRGTFSSRHAVLRDFENGSALALLNQAADSQAQVEVINSPLSEQGVMGFEFGYSVADPDGLVLWEAQFGDFVNGAQIIIDQFLVASEAKWKQVSGLVLLLPHGYEGQGPEHSSARPERFLQLCGNLNLQVAIPTTPAQHFHILRRQLHRDFRKPLIIMSPKSLLRHPKVVSPLKEFESGGFKEVLDDSEVKDAASVQRVVMCTGKLFYEVAEARDAQSDSSKGASLPVVRIEQLYPFPEKQIAAVLARYPKAREVIWTQEEPQNMGAWTYIRPRLLELMSSSMSLKYVGRKSSGTTAEGSAKAHAAEQSRIIGEAIGLTTGLSSKVASK